MLIGIKPNLLDVDLDLAIFHSNVSKLLSDERQRNFVPEFSKNGVVPLTKEKDNEADNKECHEAAFHDICLGKLDWVELFF